MPICTFCKEEFESMRGYSICWSCWTALLDAFFDFATDEQKAMTEEEY